MNESKSKRNTGIELKIYGSEKYSKASRSGDNISTVAVIRNDLSDDSAILQEGNYTLAIENRFGHKVRATQDFTVKDGDSKQIDLIISKQGDN